MTTTLKLTAAVLLAALLSAALFLSPVGISSAQEDPSDPDQQDALAEDPTDDTAGDTGDRPHGPLSDEEREALRAERQAAREEVLEDFAAELGVTPEEVTAAARAVLEDRLDERVAAGQLTEQQAERILAAYDDHGLVLPFGRALHRHGPFGGPFGR